MTKSSDGSPKRYRNKMQEKRKSFKNNLTTKQVAEMELYFAQVNFKPRRKEKLELSSKIGVEPEILNRWFQSKRKQTNKTCKKPIKRTI